MDLYTEKFFRNLGVITSKEQRKLRAFPIALVGLGGTGGTILECLLRLGCEKLILFDHDRFELTNFNRQLLATDETIDMKKTDAAVKRAKRINKDVKIEAHGTFDKIKIKNAQIVIDGTDNVETRIEIAKAARQYKIPYVFCSSGFAVGMVSVFVSYEFEKMFQLPKDSSKLASYNTCRSVIAPATSLAGTLAASQAVNYVLGKPLVKAPEVLMFDLFSKEVVWKKKLE